MAKKRISKANKIKITKALSQVSEEERELPHISRTIPARPSTELISRGIKESSIFFSQVAITCWHLLRVVISPFRKTSVLILIVLLLLCITYFSLLVLQTKSSLQAIYQVAQAKQQEQKSIQDKISKWQQLIKEYPHYRDGYIELALLYYQLGEKDEARSSLDQALALDPNYETSQALKKLIENSQ